MGRREDCPLKGEMAAAVASIHNVLAAHRQEQRQTNDKLFEEMDRFTRELSRDVGKLFVKHAQTESKAEAAAAGVKTLTSRLWALFVGVILAVLGAGAAFLFGK